jgi:hypothetical protein
MSITPIDFAGFVQNQADKLFAVLRRRGWVKPTKQSTSFLTLGCMVKKLDGSTKYGFISIENPANFDELLLGDRAFVPTITVTVLEHPITRKEWSFDRQIHKFTLNSAKESKVKSQFMNVMALIGTELHDLDKDSKKIEKVIDWNTQISLVKTLSTKERIIPVS